MYPYLIAAVFVYICWGIAILLGKLIAFLNRKKPVSFKTDEGDFTVSSGVDNLFKKNKIEETNPTILYEELCVRNPGDHKKDPRIPSVISQYNDIIHGKTPDPEGQYAPSEKIDGELNADYITYLKNQKKALKAKGDNVEWIKNELARLQKIDRADTAVRGFFSQLIDMGMPPVLFTMVVTEERMESYSPKDWKEMISHINEYLENDCAIQNIGAFLLYYDDPDIIYNHSKMYQFDMLLKHGIPVPLAKMVIEDQIHIDTMIEVITKVQERGYDWDEAMEETFSDLLENQERQEFREMYQDIVKKSQKRSLIKGDK